MRYLTGAWIVCRGPRVGVEGEATYDGTAGRMSVPVEPVKRRPAGVPARTWKGGVPVSGGHSRTLGRRTGLPVQHGPVEAPVIASGPSKAGLPVVVQRSA